MMNPVQDLVPVQGAAVMEAVVSLEAVTLIVDQNRGANQNLSPTPQKKRKLCNQSHQEWMEQSFGNLILAFWLYRDLLC